MTACVVDHGGQRGEAVDGLLADVPTADCPCACHATGSRSVDCNVEGGYDAGCGPHLDARCVMDHPTPQSRFVGLLCKRHYHWIADTLKEIGKLYELLPEVLLPGPVTVDSRASGEIDPPAPARLEVMALMESSERAGAARDPGDELWYETRDIPAVVPALGTWARMIAEERAGSSEPPQIDNTLTAVVRYLQGQRHWISHQLWIDDYAKELASLHRATAQGVGDSMWPRSIGKCPNCTTPLYNTIGIDEVTCRKCKTTWAGPALIRLRLIHEQEAR